MALDREASLQFLGDVNRRAVHSVFKGQRLLLFFTGSFARQQASTETWQEDGDLNRRFRGLPCEQHPLF